MRSGLVSLAAVAVSASLTTLAVQEITQTVVVNL